MVPNIPTQEMVPPTGMVVPDNQQEEEYDAYDVKIAQQLREAGFTDLADTMSPPEQPLPMVDGFTGTMNDVLTAIPAGVLGAVEDLSETVQSIGDFAVDGGLSFLLGRKVDLFDDNPNYEGALTPDILKPTTKVGQAARYFMKTGVKLWALNFIGAGLTGTFPNAIKFVTGSTMLPATGMNMFGASEAATTAQILAKGTAKGVVTGFMTDFTRHPNETIIDPDDPIINAEWFKDLAQYLNSDPNDPDAIKRFRQAVAWIAPNAVISFFMTGAGHMWNLHKAKTAAERAALREKILQDADNIGKEAQKVPEIDKEQQIKDILKEHKRNVQDGVKINRGEFSNPETRLNPRHLSDPASSMVEANDIYVRYLENQANGGKSTLWGDVPLTEAAKADLTQQAQNMLAVDKNLHALYTRLAENGIEAGKTLTMSEIELANILQTKISPAVRQSFFKMKDVIDMGGDVTAASEEFLDSLAVLVRAQHQLVGVRGWAGRALRAAGRLSRFENPFTDLDAFISASNPDDGIKELIKSNMNVQQIYDLGASFAAAQDVYRDGRAVTWIANQVKDTLRGQQPLDFWDSIKELERNYTYFSMLSGPRTHVGNFLGNTVKVFGTDTTDLWFARAKQFGIDEANEATSAYFGGLKRGLKTGFKVVRAAWKYDSSVLAPDEGMKVGTEMLNGDGGLLRKIMAVPGKLLNASDEVFKQAAYRGQVELQIHDFMKTAEAQAILGANPSKETIEMFKEALVDKFYGSLFINKNAAVMGATASGFKDATGILDSAKALEGALKSTWNNRPYQDAAFRVLQGISRMPGGHHLMPFTKTVYNIGKDALVEHSPLALFRLFGKAAKSDPAVAAKIWGQICTTVLMYSSVYAAYQGGLITGGGPSGKTAKALWQEEGNVPYSIKTPAGWVSLANLDPVAAPLIMLTDSLEKMDEVDPKTGRVNSNLFISAINAFTNYATNRTWLKSVADLFDVLDGDGNTADKIGRYIRKNAAGSYIPSFLATTKQMIDPYTHETQDMSGPFLNRLPFLGVEENPPKVSWLTGELIKGPYGDGGVETFLSAPFFQRKFNREERDLVFANMLKSKVERAPSRTLESGLTLNDYDYTQYCKIMGTIRIGGKTLYEALESRFTSARWESGGYGIDPDEYSLAKPKESEITKIVNKYKKAAEKEFLRTNPNAKRYLDLWMHEAKLFQKGKIQSMTMEPFDSDVDYFDSKYDAVMSAFR